MQPSRRTKLALLTAALAAALAIGATPAAAQTTGTVRGTVVESGSRRPVAGATVVVFGTTRSAVTNAQGGYELTLVPVGSQRIRASRLGLRTGETTVSVGAGAVATADLALGADAVSLDAIVVTGTPGEVQKRTLGNAITSIDVEDLTTKASVNNVTEVLQGRTPGLTLIPGSGTAGTAADIRIRGAGSLNGFGLRPVIYVDGIRYNGESLGNFNPSGSGTGGVFSQGTSALDIISPQDIESIEVIKGPAAATLYGAEAAAGVIQIITKKGTRGQQRTRWSTRVERGRSDWALEIPDNYTTCNAARLLDTINWPGCKGMQEGTILTDNPLRRDPMALRDGDFSRLSLNLRGGTDRYSFYVAGDRDREEGVQFNNFSNRNSVRANFTFSPMEKANFAVSTSYIQTHVRLPLNDDAGNGLLISAVRGRPGALVGASGAPGFRLLGPERANAYDNQTRTDRLTLGGTANYLPWTWFRNRLTVGVDFTSALAQLLSQPLSADAPQGLSAQRVPRTHIYTIDYAGTVTREVTDDIESTTAVGMQVTANKFEQLNASGTGLGAPDVTLIGTAALTSGSNNYSEQNSVGYFIQEQLGFRNRLFLTGALRADDNSAFGTDFDRIYYPKAQLAWVLSEEPAMERFFDAARLDNFKLRAAWGEAGRSPSPFSATQTYTVDKVTLGTTTGSAIRTSTYGNPNLKPERGTEYELGFDAGLFDGRAGVELTYYDKRMKDALLSVLIPGSTGFIGSRLTNLGETSNKGLELGVYATPVQSRVLGWETRLNFSTNRNELVTFGDGRTREAIFNPYATIQEHRAGYPLAAFWAPLPLRNPDGTPQMSGTSVRLDTSTYIGPSVPTREAGLANTFTLFQNFRVYAFLDYKGGHYQFNQRERNRCQTANGNCWAANDPRAVYPETAADSLMAKELPVLQTVPGVWIEQADFVKLREVSLTYSMPESLARRLRSSGASLTVSGRNLAVLWTKYGGSDPEVNFYGRQGFVRADSYTMPMTRRLSVAVNLTY